MPEIWSKVCKKCGVRNKMKYLTSVLVMKEVPLANAKWTSHALYQCMECKEYFAL